MRVSSAGLVAWLVGSFVRSFVPWLVVREDETTHERVIIRVVT